MECQLCGGAGWCPSCDGHRKDRCDLCDGTGICPHCHGTGKECAVGATATTRIVNTTGKAIPMTTTRMKNRPSSVARLVRRLERERKCWIRPQDTEVPTAQAWRAGVAEGIRLSQVAIKKGV